MRYAIVLLPILLILEEPEPEYLTPRLMVKEALKQSNQDKYTRYLTVYAIPRDERITWFHLLSARLNNSSTNPTITDPEVVKGTGGALLRINLLDYNIDPKVWDKMYEFEPYFYQTLSQQVYKDKSDGSRWFKSRDPEGRVAWIPYDESKEKVRALASWLSESDEEKEAIGHWATSLHTTSPIYDGEFWWRHTVVQESDKFDGQCPGYYDFLGLGKKQQDFEDLIAANVDIARFQFQSELRAVIKRSKVTHNNRGIGRFDKIKGGYWWTLDARQNVGTRNFLTNLDDLNVAKNGFVKKSKKVGFAQIADSDVIRFDATEQFGPLPNGLMAWWLANNKGERQDVAPDFIAGDGTAPGTDKRVHIGLSCERCHIDGIKSIHDYVRETYQPPLQLNLPDKYTQQRIKNIYFRDIDEAIEQDQLLYKKAIKRATTWDTQTYVTNLSSAWIYEQETDYDLQRVAYRCGAPKKAILVAIDNITKKTGLTNPIQAGLLKALKEQSKEESIRSEHFEELFPLFMTNLKGYN